MVLNTSLFHESGLDIVIGQHNTTVRIVEQSEIMATVRTVSNMNYRGTQSVSAFLHMQIVSKSRHPNQHVRDQLKPMLTHPGMCISLTETTYLYNQDPWWHAESMQCILVFPTLKQFLDRQSRAITNTCQAGGCSSKGADLPQSVTLYVSPSRCLACHVAVALSAVKGSLLRRNRMNSAPSCCLDGSTQSLVNATQKGCAHRNTIPLLRSRPSMNPNMPPLNMVLSPPCATAAAMKPRNAELP